MSADKFDVVIVGAGFAGLYMLHRTRAMGLSARVLEAGGGVGGTWYWNRYPGARCDVESMEYSYQFSDALQQEWEWTERYAAQPEILRYAEHVADRFSLRRDIAFATRVRAATFDEASGYWIIDTDAGGRTTARFCVMATGCLSAANVPKLEGRDSFRGAIYHTGMWPPASVDFTGLQVGVIGTGSSAIQSIPVIARQAAHLHVFQRTPNYMVPAHNGPLDPEAQRRVKADYAGLRQRAKKTRAGIDFHFNDISALAATPQERQREYENRWAAGGLPFLGAFSDLLLNLEANETAADFVRGKIRELVRDPKTADRLTPRNIFGCKRLCVDTGYWQTFNRPNVTLVDISGTPIEAITPKGLRVGSTAYSFDAIIFATGFDAMTGSLLKIDIRGRGGVSLREKWGRGPRSYLGLAIAGFPNLFTITGPGSPSVLTNMLPSIEQHVEWIAECLAYVGRHGHRQLEADRAAEDAWVSHVGEVAGTSLRSSPACSSWYLGTNIADKARVFMPYVGGFPAYVQKCEEVVAGGYDGFVLS
jgi:cyclohexanone monooxygenase